MTLDTERTGIHAGAAGLRVRRPGYCRGVLTTSLIQARVFSSRGPATLLSLAARPAFTFCKTILPSPASTAVASTGNNTDFGFSAMGPILLTAHPPDQSPGREPRQAIPCPAGTGRVGSCGAGPPLLEQAPRYQAAPFGAGAPAPGRPG